MRHFKRDLGMMLTGLALGAVLTGGAVAAGVMAEPSWSPIYVDGRRVQMTAYNIAGNNFVKLRDIGQAVGFNVYYQNGVQVDSDAPYTGEAPAQTSQTALNEIRVSSVKGNILSTGDRSGLIIGPVGADYAVTSSNPAVIAVENVSGNWVAVAKAGGTATIIVTNGTGGAGQLVLTAESTRNSQLPSVGDGIDLSANMDIRQEMIRLINQTRKANGVEELAVNDALMNAAQDCAAQGYTSHHSQYECETAIAYGYPHGFGSNLTAFTGVASVEIPQHAVQNWIESPGHFQTMVTGRYTTIGVGVYVDSQWTYCYMFVGDPNSHNPYE